jgi:hypothetical protein
MLIAPLIREPGRVVSTGRALVPTQPNFNDLFFFDGVPVERCGAAGVLVVPIIPLGSSSIMDLMYESWRNPDTRQSSRGSYNAKRSMALHSRFLAPKVS